MSNHPYKLGMEVITNTIETGEVVEIDTQGPTLIRVLYDDKEYRNGGEWYYDNGEAFVQPQHFKLTMEPKNS